jgi:cytochrome c oxidase subunit 1
VAGNCVFFPMHILGTAGLRRRIADFTQSVFERPLLPMNQFISISAFVLGAAQIIFIINFFWSLFKGPVAGRNPWHSNTLEWTAPSPPPHGNFEVPPVVYRGPYEYGAKDVPDDYLPQTQMLIGEPPSPVEAH